MAASFDDTSFEISEALFDINGEDTYFGNVFEADFLKSDSLSLGKTVRNDVGYGTYLLHYILGTILTWPHTRLLEKLNIEDVFFKLESIDSGIPNVIKVFVTFKAAYGKKYLHYQLFDFEEKALFRNLQKLTTQDLAELSWKLRQKGKNLREYSLSKAKHLKIFKPSTGKPYEVTEEWKNEGSDIAVLDVFSAIPSEKSPVVAKESLIPFSHLEDYVPEDSVAESRFIDALDPLPGNSEKIVFPRFDQEPDVFRMQLTDMFAKLATIYRTYDVKYNLKLSASRVDHCGFVHGALSMNLKNYHKISLHVENREMNHHDSIKMVITSNSEDILSRMTRKPILVDFRDVDTARVTVKATDFVMNNKAVELPPYVQTLAEECFYAAVCLTSMNSPASIIAIKTEPKPSSISKLMAENAETIYSHYLNAEQGKAMYKSQRKALEDKLYKAFDTVQSTEQLTDMKNLRCLSRYIMGEAGSYSENSPKIYLRQNVNFELDPETDDLRKRLTTFVIETENPNLDLVVNFFENPTRHEIESIYDANEHTCLPTTRSTVTHTIVVNTVIWLNEGAFSDTDLPFPLKNFFKRQILVEPVNAVSNDPQLIEESIRRLPSVDIHDLISNVDQVVFPSAERSNHLASFFHESQELIDNPSELVSVIKGMFSSRRTIHQNVKATTGGSTSGCQVIPFKEKEYQLIREVGILHISKLRIFSFSYLDRRLSMTSGDGMFYDFPTLLAKASNVATCSYNVIFNKKGQRSKNSVITTRIDYDSNSKNFKQLLQGCIKFGGITRFKRNDICELPHDENAKLIDSNAKLMKPSRFQLNLKTVQKVSMITAHGMIIKDMVANIFDGDFKGLCFNVGFVAGGFAASHLADKIFELGTRFAGIGKSYLGRALMLSSPFLRRATSGLIIYDLINSIQRYRNNDTEAVVDVAEDGFFLSIDAVDIGVEIAEAFGVVEGLSAFTGPIGLGVGAVAMIGGEIYKSVREVNKLDHIYHLTGWEKLKVGLKKFFHVNLEPTIKEMEKSRFDPVKTVFQMYEELLKKNPNVKMYTGPMLTNRSTATFTEFETDSNINLVEKEARDNWLEINSKNSDFSATCRPNVRSHKMTGQFFVCHNAIGVESELGDKNEKRVVLTNVGDGTDIAHGMHGHENVFMLGNGNKRIFGGNMTNTFILNGNKTSGLIFGMGDQNVLDLSKFNLNGSVSYLMKQHSVRHSRMVDKIPIFSILYAKDMHIVKGRKDEADNLWASANLSKVDLQGGNEQKYDSIFIDDDAIAYNLTVNVASYTKIKNNAVNGKFIYIYQSGSTNNTVHIRSSSAKASHVFVFDFEYWHITSMNIILVNKTRRLNFKFSKIDFANLAAKIKKFTVNIGGQLRNCVFQFRNNFFIYSPDGKKFFGNLITSNSTTGRIINVFRKIVNIWKIPVIVHNPQKNWTVVFGAHMHKNPHQKNSSTVISNDPEHITHMIGGPGENIYAITSDLNATSLNHKTLTKYFIIPDVFIYKSKYTNSKSYVIDLRTLYSKLDTAEIRLEISPLSSIFLIHVNIVTSMNMEFGLCRIFLKDFTVESLKSQVLVLGNVPMKIRESNSKLILQAVPLKFTKNETKIILTHNDIDYNQEIFIDRFLAKYSIFYSNATNLVITDKFSRPIDDEFSSILILKDFYVFYKMRTLIFKFSNQVIEFNDKARFIQANLVNLESLSSDVWF